MKTTHFLLLYSQRNIQYIGTCIQSCVGLVRACIPMLCSRIRLNSSLFVVGIKNCSSAARIMENSSCANLRSSWKKRRVAIILGYIGTNYRGLQLNPDFPSIEKEVMRALHEVGSVSDDNAYKPSKMAWSRSSRTDKGVHASRTVISANILLRPDWPMDSNAHFPELVHMINSKLPEDIRVFEIVRMNGGFNARFACHMRYLCFFVFAVRYLL